MRKNNISGNLLFTQNHFDLLIKLNRISFDKDYNLEDIYNLNTETIVEGLGIDRASYWKIETEKLVCINLFDKNTNFHTKETDLFSQDLPVYFKALSDGIAIVANDVFTNEYTQELKENYFTPLKINNLLDLPIRENGKVVGVLCCEHRDKNRIWNESDLAFAKCVSDVLILMIEQNKRRKTERKLLDIERKLSLITNNSTDGFVILENRKLTYVSENYLKFMGFSKKEMLKTTMEDIFSWMHPDDVEEVKAIIYSNLSQKNKNFKYSFRIKNKAGVYCWREDWASVLYGTTDELYSKYMTISRDISAVKKAELEIEKLYMISKNQNNKLLDFTHILSHNIRSNTSNIAMIIDLIEQTDSETEKKEYFQLLKESNDKLSNTIYSLNESLNLKMSRKDQRTQLNVKSQIKRILLGINAIIKDQKVAIHIEISDDFEINTIASYFENIFLNLITNAIQYKSPDRNPEIIIKAKKTETKTVFKIKDNGLGIDMERNKDKIFGMYKTFHGNEDAVGLGLFMTKNHVEALGGKIRVTSKVGIGSTFKFTLHD